MVPFPMHLKFRYPSQEEWLFQTGVEQAAQGTLVCLIGPHRGGKTTFLKLLAELSFPQEGRKFIPSHIRVLHVSQDPVLLRDGLFKNVTLGSERVDVARVYTIVERLKLHEYMYMIEHERQGAAVDLNWLETNRRMDKSKPSQMLLQGLHYSNMSNMMKMYPALSGIVKYGQLMSNT